jgi:hypothetical protein
VSRRGSRALWRVLTAIYPAAAARKLEPPKKVGALAGAREEKGEFFEWEKLSIPISARKFETLAFAFDAQCISFVKQKSPAEAGLRE